MNIKHMIIAVILVVGIIAAGLIAMVAMGGGLYTRGPAQQTIGITGTVTYIDLEGGFYGIVADDGTQYLPLDLPEEFRQDGRAVTAEVIVRDDVATIQMWGTPVEIVDINAPATVAVNGTVTYIDLEGGFYGIVADDGAQYLPLDLPEEFRQDGRAVTAEVIIRDDVATIQQWGTPVEIVDINAPATVAVNGTVTYIDLEGGFYGIVADDGAQYLPLDLPEEFRQDGRAVTAEVIVRDDVATIQQWGTPVEIAAIEAA